MSDIISRSVIVRTPWTNERVKVQKGAFILINANMIKEIKQKPVSPKVTENLIDSEYIHLREIQNGGWCDAEIPKDCKSGDIHFRKIKPYDQNCPIDRLKYDPFSLRYLVFKNEEGNIPVVLIPPFAKKNILSQLKRLGFTEDYVYPDMETITHEINDCIK